MSQTRCGAEARQTHLMDVAGIASAPKGKPVSAPLLHSPCPPRTAVTAKLTVEDAQPNQQQLDGGGNLQKKSIEKSSISKLLAASVALETLTAGPPEVVALMDLAEPAKTPN